MSMRPYQAEAIRQIGDLFKSGTRKVLLVMPTGGGKTHIFSDVIKRTALKGNECVMAVRGRKLVDQASKRLFREDVDHGVLMANHWNVKPKAGVQVCSIDTVLSRKHFPPAKLLVLDEAHLMVSPQSRAFIEHYAAMGTYILGVTATPWTKEPLEHLADAVVQPVTMADLIAEGYLVPARYFVPSEPDMRGVKVSAGEYNQAQALERMSLITGDLVEHWRRFAEGRPTLCFAVNVEHSKRIAELFNAAGISTGHVDASTKDKDRAEQIRRLEAGEIKVLTNCGILCTGVDIPTVSCILMARPTKSLNLYLQIAGRGTRTAQGKSDFLILDHAGNVRRHGFITDDREVFLDRVSDVAKPVQVKICPQCFLAYSGFTCPGCGHEPEAAGGRRSANQVDGTLTEIRALSLADQVAQEIKRLKDVRKAKGYKQGWVYHKLVDKYGQEIADQFMPKRQVPEWVNNREALKNIPNWSKR